MKNMICIVCPRGCELQVEGEEEAYLVTGNACNRGKEFAIAELLNPMRTVQSTVKTVFPELPMLPVRTDGMVPKEAILPIIKETAGIIIKSKKSNGEIIVENISGTGVNLISTTDMNLYCKNIEPSCPVQASEIR